MTLEDFFTLTEMKDGLSSLARVAELVSTMKKENSYSIKNFSDAARQWSTVASILAATENIDCLNHFILLEGLCFLDQWLQEAQRSNDDENGESSEEAINSLLGALEKLPINKETATGGALGVTVSHLFAHKSINIQRRAKKLHECWFQMKEENVVKSDIGKDGVDESECKHSIDTKNAANRRSSKIIMPNAFHPTSIYSDNSSDTPVAENQQLRVTVDVSQNRPVDEASCPTTSLSNNSYDVMHRPNIVAETSFVHPVEGLVSAGSCVSLTVREGPDYKPSDVPEPYVGSLKGITDSGAGVKDRSSCKSCVTATLGREGISISSPSTSSANTGHQKMLDDKLNNFEAGSISSPKKSSLSKNGKPESHSGSTVLEPESGTGLGFKSCSAESATPRRKGSNNAADIQVKPSECMSASTDQKSFLSAGLLKDPKEPDVKKTEIMAGYDFDDGVLECARQVVKDLEKEVGNFKESLDHFPYHNDDRMVVTTSISEQPSSAQTVDRKLTEVDSSSSGQTPLTVVKPTKESEDQLREHDSSQLESAEQELDSIPSRRAFDLNEDVDMEEIEHPKAAYGNQPIKVVAASIGATCLPVTPLQFEGELGWKGTAATSAFRPASPRKTVGIERVDAISHSSKPSQNGLRIDLNIAEDVDGVTSVPTGRSTHFASSLLWDNPSVSSKRAERLSLDLNRVDGEDGCSYQSDWKQDRHVHPHQNGHHFSSPATWLSSSRQPSMRNIDLNDNPSFLDSAVFDHQKSEKPSFQPLKAFSDNKFDHPVISIMGSKIGPEKKDFLGPTQPFFLSGQEGSVYPIAANTGRFAEGTGSTSVAYTTSQLPFAYSGLSMRPPLSVSPAIYVPTHLPYMLDARGNTVIPENLTPVNSSFFRPPFYMSITNAPSGVDGTTMMRPEGNSQAFTRRYGSMVDETAATSTAQQTVVGATGSLKRKDPEGGWETYSVGIKQVPPWQA